MEQKENLSNGEREMMSLHDLILSAFRRRVYRYGHWNKSLTPGP